MTSPPFSASDPTAEKMAACLPKRFLVALDASDHANRGITEAVRLAGMTNGEVTGIHVYAARLHDQRFRQMESGLPDRYREEQVLEHQRRVHDDLISAGLQIVSDGYHDTASKTCRKAEVSYRALSREGKNYRRIVEAVRGGGFDLLVLGALGLGTIPGALVGTVCERVARRSPIDVLVVRDPGRQLGDGPIVVGLDGSARSFGALRVALDLGQKLKATVHAVAVFDPYFHHVAFKRIAGVLSAEKGQKVRLEEQERLHEELIDDGLAKIYRSHLEIAKAIAGNQSAELVCKLLDGKPHQAIARHVGDVGACLVLVGRTGIHADPDLDIGGTAENLMRVAPCHVWLGATAFTPPLDTVAQETITWTAEAESRMTHVPETARAMVRTAILRFASNRGHTMITSGVIDDATAALCPHFGGGGEATVEWSNEARSLVDAIADEVVRVSVRLRAEKKARRERRRTVVCEDVHHFLDTQEREALRWDSAALARLARVPDIVRRPAQARIEVAASEAGATAVTLELVEAVLKESKRIMGATAQAGGHPKPLRSGG